MTANILKLPRYLKKLSLVVLILITLTVSCKKKEDNNKTNLLLLAAFLINNARNTDMYTGFADIPASIYQATSQTSVNASLATDDYKFKAATGTASVAGVYNHVRNIAKNTRDIAKFIGDLVKALEDANIAVSSTALTGSDKWGDQPAKYSYKTSATISGGKLLEIWWNNAPAPYGSNKAIEINYTGSSSSGDISGYLWVRYRDSTTATTLSKAYIKFDYKSSTNTRTMVVILQGAGPTLTDRAHFFVSEVNGVTSMDGAFTVLGYNPNATGVAASDRVYVFNAVGNKEKAVVQAAFPLTNDNSTSIYGNTTLGNIGQVWTSWLLADSSVVSGLNGTGITSCNSANISLTPNSGNPTTLLPAFSVANLKTCLDALPVANVQNVYFLTNIKNPAYFKFDGKVATLYGVESLDAGDANKSAFAELQVKLLSSTRTVADTSYSATMDGATVATINLFTGTGIPVGTSANTLPSLNTQWGNGTPGTGNSSSSAGRNSINNSIDNLAPF